MPVGLIDGELVAIEDAVMAMLDKEMDNIEKAQAEMDHNKALKHALAAIGKTYAMLIGAKRQ